MPYLMLKEKKVLSFQEEGGRVLALGKIEDRSLLPLCLVNECSLETFNEWLGKRALPDNREGLADMKADFGSDWLRNKNRLSLSDQYWVQMRTETWRKINYFHNRYSLDIGNMAFKPWECGKRKIDSNSPDLTTNGILRKRWKPGKGGVSYLVKAGSKATHQEPLSEVLVSVLLEKLQIMPFVRYDLCIEGTTMCSKCDNFIQDNTELVPMSYIYHQEPRDEKKESVYHHLLKMCDKYEIPGMEEFIDAMIFIDNMTGNEDRNLGNIAVIRDVDTMKILGPAPLFDFGAAYWSSGKINDNVRSKYFGDVEKKVIEKMRNKCDIESALKNTDYIKCIETYPRITREKKENLIKAIRNRNARLITEKSMKLGELFR